MHSLPILNTYLIHTKNLTSTYYRTGFYEVNTVFAYAIFPYTLPSTPILCVLHLVEPFFEGFYTENIIFMQV